MVEARFGHLKGCFEIEDRLAVLHDDNAPSEHAERLLAAEQHARSLEKGIWGRDLKPLGGWPPNDAAPGEFEPDSTIQIEPAPVPVEEPAIDRWVWVTRSGVKFHRAECPHLTDTARRVSREEANEQHEACKTCRPDG